MQPISHTGFAFGIIGNWTDVILLLVIIYFAVKLFKTLWEKLRNHEAS
jgi:hypothetical protein